MSIVLLATAKEHLKISAVNTAENTTVQLMIDTAEEWVQRFLEVFFNGGTPAVTEDLDGGGKNLWPRQKPVDFNTVIVIVDNDDDETILQTDTEYEVYEDRITFPDEGWWPSGRKRYQVTYNGGYTDVNVPKGIQMAILQIVYRLYYARGGVKEVEDGTATFTYEMFHRSDIASNLQMYRLGNFVG